MICVERVANYFCGCPEKILHHPARMAFQHSIRIGQRVAGFNIPCVSSFVCPHRLGTGMCFTFYTYRFTYFALRLVSLALYKLRGLHFCVDCLLIQKLLFQANLTTFCAT